MQQLPEGKSHTIITSEPEPPFLDELAAKWGHKWGAADEVSTLRTVLMRKPNPGLRNVRADAWNEEAGALIDPDKNWSWLRREPPDWERLLEQHANFRATLEGEGIEVVLAPDLDKRRTKSTYTRDPLVTIPGGAIILRLAPHMRRGEEQSITATVAQRGVPILGTLVGTATAEGGSFVKLRPNLAAYGTSIRCNVEGFNQLARHLEMHGIELIEVPLAGYRIHLDGALLMVDHDLAMVNTNHLPYTFLTKLWDLGIETFDPHPDERWAINSLVISPRRLIMGHNLPRTAELMNKRFGAEIIPLQYDEIAWNGGSFHCSTMELMRDW